MSNFIKRKILLIFNIICVKIDKFIPKKNKYWIFPVYFIGKGNFCDNNLALYEKVKNNSDIKKIILTRDISVNIDGINTVIIPMKSLKAVWYLLRSNVIFIQHSLWLDLKSAKFQIIEPLSRKIINTWHGIAFKDISHSNTGIINERSKKEMKNYYITASSDTDKKNMKKAFYLVDERNIWVTGLPRNDFLKVPLEKLPVNLKEEYKKILELKKNKKLFIYAPTYRETDVGGKYYDFSDEELKLLNKFLEENNAILGIRYHFFRQPTTIINKLLKYKNIIDLSDNVISDMRILIRASDLIITDYSSLFLDALYIDVPCISFAYDYEHYMKVQRGFFYDFKKTFPGEICYSFNELIKVLQNNETFHKKYVEIKNIFFKYTDDNNSERVIKNVLNLIREN